MKSNTFWNIMCGKSADPKHMDIALLIIRVSVALTFIAHGWQKMGNMEGTIGFFASLGFGAVLAYFVAYIEFLGGILLLLGGATRIVGILFSIIMVIAIFTVHFKNGFIASAGGYEFQLLLLVCSIALALIGPGRISLNHKIRGDK